MARKNSRNTRIKERDYVAIADAYRSDVIAGRIRASKWVRLACEREKADRERDWEFEFKPKWANNVATFISNLHHVQGQWAKRGETIKLEPWQCFALCTLFGWVERGSDIRRYRTCYWEMGRKNSKSTTAAGVALYCLACDGEHGAQVFSAATSHDQARLIFDVAKRMVERDSELRRHMDLSVSAHAIYQESTGSTFKALSAEYGSLDGLNIHCAVVDELHAHKQRRVWDVLETAKASRKQPLLLAVTTAGSDRSGICYETRGYLTKILEGVVEDPRFFGLIYTLDDGMDWQDESVWPCANPNLGVSVDITELRALARKAASTPAAVSAFQTRHMSMWVSADRPLFDAQKWISLGDPSLTPERFRDQPCWLAVDLAPRHDFSVIVALFRDDDGDYHAFARHFLSEGEVQNSTNSSYLGWSREGWIETNPGDVTDYGAIEDALEQYVERYQVREVLYDPFSAHQFATRMTDKGYPMIEMRATVANFSEPTKKLDALITSGAIHHDSNPAFAWCVSNTVGHYDRKGNVYPTRESPEQCIDSSIALIMALGRAILNEGGSVYDSPDPEEIFV